MSATTSRSPGSTMFKILSAPYDFLTYPLYYALNRPSKEDIHPIQGIQEDPNDPYSPWRCLREYEPNLTDGVTTFDQMIRKVIKHFGSKNAVGYRKILRKNFEKQSNGKTFLKFNLASEYTWLSYNQYNLRIENLMKGLIGTVGIKAGDIVMIFMETRLEWMLMANACYRMGAIVGTLYATLGDDGIIHGINETETTVLVTSNDLLKKVGKLYEQLPNLKTIIYVRNEIGDELEEPSVKEIQGIELKSIDSIEEGGANNNDVSVEEPKADDPCVLMYTSGSTGKPKGIILTQENMLHGVRNISLLVGDCDFSHDASFAAFLPAAHIMECLAEPLMLTLGISVGYCSTFTLMVGAPGLEKGCKSDLEVLKPEVMVSVPLMLDRMRKIIEVRIGGRGKLVQSFFDFALEYKGSWNHSGHKTPLIDRLIADKAKRLFGGKIKMLICGGAPLSADTQAFIRNCLGVNVTQGYAATETGGSGCFAIKGCWKVGTCGPPLPNVRVKLVDWDEGNYRATDKPHPRGEIVIGSKAVSSCGYYKNEEASQEVFYQEDNLHWFRTGDIGEMLDDGTIKIIDRKKDLVKLAFGEYVSLGKVIKILTQGLNQLII